MDDITIIAAIHGHHVGGRGVDVHTLSCSCPITTIIAEETLCESLSAAMKRKVIHKGKTTVIMNADVTNRKTHDSTHTTQQARKILISTSVQLCQNRMK